MLSYRTTENSRSSALLRRPAIVVAGEQRGHVRAQLHDGAVAARGAAVVDSSVQSIIPAIPSAARDVVGAGDAFAAGALAALLGSASLEDAMLSGLATASLTVEVDGPTDPKLNKLRVQERMRHRVS